MKIRATLGYTDTSEEVEFDTLVEGKNWFRGMLQGLSEMYEEKYCEFANDFFGVLLDTMSYEISVDEGKTWQKVEEQQESDKTLITNGGEK